MAEKIGSSRSEVKPGDIVSANNPPPDPSDSFSQVRAQAGVLPKEPVQGKTEIESMLQSLQSKVEKHLGPEIKTRQERVRSAQLALDRFNKVQKMDYDDWSRELTHVQDKLSHSEKMSSEEIADLKSWLEALVHYPEEQYEIPVEHLATAVLLLAIASVQEQSRREHTGEPSPELQNIPEQMRAEAVADYKTKIESELQKAQTELANATQDSNYQAMLSQIEKLENYLQIYQEREHEIEKAEAHKRKELATARYKKKALELRNLSKELRLAQKTIQNNEKEDTSLMEPSSKQEFGENLSETKIKADNLEKEFILKLNELERFDLQCKIETKGFDPYLPKDSAWTPSNITSWIKSSLWESPIFGEIQDPHPEISELVEDFNLARLGLDSISEAYQKVAGDAYSNLSNTWSSLTKASLIGLLKKPAELLLRIKDFARDYPREARELAANLAHAYSILTIDDRTTGKQLQSEIQSILDRRTLENQVSDLVLGSQDPRYSTAELKPMSAEQLALIDFARKAPYIAGAIMQDSLTGGQGAKAVLSWIPGVGEYRPLRAALGAAGAIAEVRVQKTISDQLTREAEVMANSLKKAFEAYPNGGLQGAVAEFSKYRSLREAMKQSGDFFRAVVETVSITKAMLEPWRQKPKEETAKTVVAAGVGGLAGFGAFGTAVATAGGVITLAPVVLGIGTLLTVGFGARKATTMVAEKLKSAETKLDEKQSIAAKRIETAYNRLKEKQPELPDLNSEDYKEVATHTDIEKAMKEVVGRAIQRQEQQELEALAEKAGAPANAVAAVINEAAGRA